jgi:cysteinyl-tRNA synthetase
MFFPFIFGTTKEKEASRPSLFIYNTLTQKKEIFIPLRKSFVTLYHCGPTVYDRSHIGNIRSYVFSDILRKTLELNSYKVKQVINITDIGHLTSDADDGDDKMSLGLKREGLPHTKEGLKSLSKKYTALFIEDLKKLNIALPHFLPKASEHIEGDIALIETLLQKEYAYHTRDGIYFDTKRFPSYGKLGHKDKEIQKGGARIILNTEKRNDADFALWKKSIDKKIGWESPWGNGFPGWHIECSVMSMQYLGKQIDIHTGGIDHIGTHHNNEKAQSEASTGKQFVRYWMHHEHILLSKEKISKSKKNTISLPQLEDHGYTPLAYRYFLLMSHYRTQVNFTFNTLLASQKTLKKLHCFFVENLLPQKKKGKVNEKYALSFFSALNNDLDTPRALALLHSVVKDSSLSLSDKKATILFFDRVLSLGFRDFEKRDILPLSIGKESLEKDIEKIKQERDNARKEKNWEKADTLRKLLFEKGYTVFDGEDGKTHIEKREFRS